MKDSATASSSTPFQPQAKPRWTPDSPHRALRLALASASLLSLATAAPLASNAAGALPVADHVAPAASASASGVYVTILSPNPQTQLSGVKQVEIRAYYESSFGVSGVDLFIDGHRAASQQLAKPEERGEIAFVVEASSLSEGAHSIVVRATATDQEVSSARAEMTLPAPSAPEITKSINVPASGVATANADAAGLTATAGGPAVGIVSPSPSSVVAGIVEIKVDASDASGKAPYVSLFVDNQFKTLRNFAPYTFDLDTSHLTNGKHTVEVWGYNDSQQVTHARPLEIVVNNPGGHTFERHDLSDDASVAKLAARAHLTRGGAVISAHLPAATRPEPRAAEFAPHKSAAAQPPSIAHTARKALSQIIAKADRLASLGSTGGLLDSAGQNESAASAIVAPAFTPRGVSTDTFETRTFAAPAAPQAIVRSHSLVHKLLAHQVPALRSAWQAPAIAGLNTGKGEMLIAASTKLEPASGVTLDTGGDDNPAMPGNLGAIPQIAAPRGPAPVKIASSNLGPGEDSASAAIKKARSAEAAPQKASDKSRIEAAADQRKAMLKNTVGKKSNAASAGRNGTVVLADFRPHDIAALRGAEEVMLNNRSVDLNQPIQDRGAMLFAPIRQIIEQQGGTLEWDAAKRQVSAVTSNRAVTITIGSRTASVNNQSVKLNSAPYLYNDRTMLPLDFFQKALNAKVSYDSATGHLLIQSK